MSTEHLLPWPEDTGRIVLKEVDSTMNEAARRAGGLERPTWIMAVHQTGGRGRRGKPWMHPKGNFAASYVMKPNCGPARAALRSFTAANALFETLALYAGRDGLALKWPNDVLLNGGKVAGILLESTGQGAGLNWLTIGFGVNLRHTPAVEDAAFPPVSLASENGRVPDLEDMLSTLASNLATQELLFRELGFEPIRESWLRQAARLGEKITVKTGTDAFEGVFRNVDEAGHLVLETPEGERRVAAAEVFF